VRARRSLESGTQTKKKALPEGGFRGESHPRHDQTKRRRKKKTGGPRTTDLWPAGVRLKRSEERKRLPRKERRTPRKKRRLKKKRGGRRTAVARKGGGLIREKENEKEGNRKKKRKKPWSAQNWAQRKGRSRPSTENGACQRPSPDEMYGSHAQKRTGVRGEEPRRGSTMGPGTALPTIQIGKRNSAE